MAHGGKADQLVSPSISYLNGGNNMKLFAVAGIVTTSLLAGCATSPEMIECLQPNRRVVLEVVGTTVKPAPKPKPEAKPEAGKPEAGKPEAKPEAKPAKPELVPAELTLNVQGNTAFDFKSATLKKGGMEDIDQFLKTEVKGKVPVTISAIILAGHSDRLEGDSTELSEARAKAVMDYLVSKGLDRNLMFWEGRGSRDPVAVTKFCED
jgi:OOP family OmpA-OmpF porin